MSRSGSRLIFLNLPATLFQISCRSMSSRFRGAFAFCLTG